MMDPMMGSPRSMAAKDMMGAPGGPGMPEGPPPEEPPMGGSVEDGIMQIEMGLENIGEDVARQVRSHLEAIRGLVEGEAVETPPDIEDETPMGEEA